MAYAYPEYPEIIRRCTVGLMNFIKGEFIEVIAWEDDSSTTMAYKFPIEGKQQIKNGAQLIVRPSQMAIFVYEGEIADVFEPGRYELTTDTMPVLTSLKNWKYLMNSPFKTDVYFINTKQFINQRWGTSNPIMMRDADFGMLRLRGFGVYSFRVKEPVDFLKEVMGSNRFFNVEKINEYLKSLVVSTTTDVLGEAGIPAMDLATQYEEIGEQVKARLSQKFAPYGLEISDFAVENISLPESVEQAIDKRTQMGALGDMNKYMQYQAAEAMRDAARNEGGGMASMGAGMGAGMGIGKMMSDAMGTANTAQPAAPAQAPKADSVATVPCPNCQAGISPGAKFCPECGFSLVKRCIHCNAELNGNPKFCPECGKPQTLTCPKCNASIEGSPKFCPECGNALQADA